MSPDRTFATFLWPRARMRAKCHGKPVYGLGGIRASVCPLPASGHGEAHGVQLLASQQRPQAGHRAAGTKSSEWLASAFLLFCPILEVSRVIQQTKSPGSLKRSVGSSYSVCVSGGG